MKKFILIAAIGTVAMFAAACSSTGDANANRNTTTNTATTNTSTPNTATTAAGHADAPGASDDAPANVKAVFTDAQSITTQHKDLSAAQVTKIEKDTNTKIADKDHHSYLAFSTTGGARKQIGAATVVKAGGIEMVIIYESRNGVPYIKEVRAEGVPQAFLAQFKGKGHDDKFLLGQDIKPNGADDATARAAADAIRQDSVVMQTLYGGAHSH